MSFAIKKELLTVKALRVMEDMGFETEDWKEFIIFRASIFSGVEQLKNLLKYLKHNQLVNPEQDEWLKGYLPEGIRKAKKILDYARNN